ncbi:hypothetical protein B0A48_10504 [Cryoendolithus antarcticus]|uniref:Karyogamy protein 5 n=1 Tax=Cryoendolithus antarcticus TaxID=1507870 RepID=A0A1V8SXH6_9PEZI|nr:hypothetical protein B0A48_10504 [Cryoendolithus antarcticus]
MDTTAEAEDNTNPRGPDTVLDEAKSIFATRFAICEIAEVKASFPPECTAFIPTEQNAKKKGLLGKLTAQGPFHSTVNYPVYEATTGRDLDICRSALETRAQWWTSYSNSRQNAVSLCHAVRGEIEKDEQLHLHKILAETTADLGETLRQSKQEAEDATQAFHDLVLNVRQFHFDLTAEDELMLATVKQMWNDFSGDMQEGVEDLMHGMRKLAENVHDTDVQIAKSGKTTLATMDEVLAAIKALAQQHQQELALVSTEAKTAREQMQFANELFQQNVVQSIYAITRDLEISNNFVQTTQQSVRDLQLDVAGTSELTMALATQLHSLTSQVQNLRGDHQELHKMANDTMALTAQSRLDAESAQKAWAEVMGSFSSLGDLFACLSSLGWYLLGFTGMTFTIIAFCTVPGSMAAVLSLIANGVRLTFQHLLSLLCLAVLGGYLMYVESPTHVADRWRNDGILDHEKVLVAVFCAIVLGAWTVGLAKRCFARPSADGSEGELEGLPTSTKSGGSVGRIDEKRGLWFNDPKAFREVAGSRSVV